MIGRQDEYGELEHGSRRCGRSVDQRWSCARLMDDEASELDNRMEWVLCVAGGAGCGKGTSQLGCQAARRTMDLEGWTGLRWVTDRSSTNVTGRDRLPADSMVGR